MLAAASLRDRSAMSVSHTNASIPIALRIASTSRCSSTSVSRSRSGSRASAIHAIARPLPQRQGKRTPLHTHPVDESLYVVEGTILVHLAGVEHLVDAGGLVIAPRDVPHAFLVESQTATVLTLHTPGTCQAFYLGASEPLTGATSRVVDFDRVRASAMTNGGIEILGPPPFPLE